jgi:hypothetical protein
MITKEQFDNLKIGDVIVNSEKDNFTIIDRTSNLIFIERIDSLVSFLSFTEFNKYNYSIKSTPKHLYGIPFGDYSDKEVYAIVSNEYLEIHDPVYAVRLLKVDENGFEDYYTNTWKYAKVISNNVDLIPYE